MAAVSGGGGGESERVSDRTRQQRGSRVSGVRVARTSARRRYSSSAKSEVSRASTSGNSFSTSCTLGRCSSVVSARKIVLFGSINSWRPGG